MKTLPKIAVTTAAAIGIALAAAAYAHGPGYGSGQGAGMMGAHGGGAGHGMHAMSGGAPGNDMHAMSGGGRGASPCGGAGMVDARLDSIKSELKLSAKQSKAWKAFEKAVRTQAQTVGQGRAGGSQSADERIAFMEQQLAGMKAIQKARADLYSVLTPEQQTLVDQYGMRGMHGPRG
ncbi:MAG: hypothetical protein BMS9Abin10_0177 [Gammaproteobacteria bacterium]|nr:MAG: hypothetical protein BMS9Abin10_0177 [Gammaproteobacteria bacterium]